MRLNTRPTATTVDAHHHGSKQLGSTQRDLQGRRQTHARSRGHCHWPAHAAARSWARRLRPPLLTAAAVLMVLTVPSVALADPVHTLALAGSVGAVLDNIRNWIMGVLAGVATVFLTIGGLRYVMAGGDPGEVQKAKIAFKSAGIGYGLAALAPLVVAVLKGIVGA